MILLMFLFEKRAFLLDDRAKVVLLENIPNCLGADGVGEDVVDKMGSLDSIFKLPSSDLVNNGLFITRRNLGRATPFAVFLVCTNFFVDSTNGRLP